MSYFLQQGIFVMRFRYWNWMQGAVRKFWYVRLGMQIGRGTILPKVYITWPHQIAIGDYCTLEQSIYFKFDGLWQAGPSIRIANRVFIGSGCEFNITKTLTIGDDALIASGCRFVDHDHGIHLGTCMRNQLGREQAITIGNDVWLGCDVVVLKGVTIGDGAVVAAGAVVTKSILPYEIWAGVPARKIGQRT
ncbi:Hexapeptide repeat of succinyl-transferase [Hymenobacter arizonensis]|uniref:Hexapeptide repeat of succinyl-transferase n=1 Tax=Hymenobacter arizonensis TaxID=1227077 RepID=A0A1I6BRT0_HYMAR|nr:acyltransferase [Hymenobacter arizonensis]SFQ83594.1 Hexapeptide repeat of succinyl-transferase [Hymenobacter arizonensis]